MFVCFKVSVLRNVCLFHELHVLSGQRVPVLIHRFTAVPVGASASANGATTVPVSAAFQTLVGVCCFGQPAVVRGFAVEERVGGVGADHDLLEKALERVDKEANRFTAPSPALGPSALPPPSAELWRKQIQGSGFTAPEGAGAKNSERALLMSML